MPKVLYTIASLKNDAVIGEFYQRQLTKVIDQDEYLIEEILDENDTDYLVKFIGYDDPEWTPKENVSNTIKDILWRFLKYQQISGKFSEGTWNTLYIFCFGQENISEYDEQWQTSITYE